jgi:hypothetical protein
MARWGFIWAGFRLNPGNPFAPVTRHQEIVIEIISFREILLEEYVEPDIKASATNGLRCSQTIPDSSTT